MKQTLFFILFLSFISCGKKSEDKPKVSACEKKLNEYHICLLSQFYSASCDNMTEQRSKELIEFCQKKHITEDLKKQCTEKMNEYQKTISDQKLNKCKKTGAEK